MRTDSRQFLYVVMNKIVDAWAPKIGVEAQYLSALSAKEFCEVLVGKSIPDNLQKRWEHCVLIPESDGRYNMLTDADADKFLKEHLLEKVLENNGLVKGQVAFPGKVQGKVRLVFGPQHNSKVKAGDILVSLATSPQLLPAMKVAGAFVTDVGGITSHAAIVARELKIPCIVGTKLATQIFKDDDLVEVDANNGIVRKLS